MRTINRVKKTSSLMIEKGLFVKEQLVPLTIAFRLLHFLLLVAALPVLSFSQIPVPLNGGHSYTTNFPLTENPISEGGNWVNGGTIGIDWTNVSTAQSLVIGHQVGVSYSDGTALLTGAWAPDQKAKAVVYSINQDDECYQEVELRLRSSLSPHSCKGYEINFKASKTSNAYLQIVRWNGALGDFTYLESRNGAQYGVKTGDTVEATIVGNVITAYINGVQLLQATDTVFKSGSPGIGFNLENKLSGCRGTNGNYGFTYFKAIDLTGK
ncbi:MAG: hypothetical protein ABJA71_11550 [Ginsengibacter sp.]